MERESTSYLNPLIFDYFARIFSAGVEEPDLDLLAKVNPRGITLYDDLMKPYIKEEVKRALFSIRDTKVPESDGLHALFLRNLGIFLGRSSSGDSAKSNK
jgi:hypothetical protein